MIVRDLSSLLVTGGAGFIGSALIKKLLKKDDVRRILVLDCMLHPEARYNLSKISQDPRVKIQEGNLNNSTLISNLITKNHFTGIFHLAAPTSYDTIHSALPETISDHIGATTKLLEQARKADIPLISCSSGAIYGTAPFPTISSESTPITPISLPAATLASCDLLMQAAHQTYAQDLIICRASSCYGPGQDRGKLIPKMIYHALRDEPLPIHGSGRHIRDWMHVEDCALGLITCFQKSRRGGIYNLGAHCERTNLGIARIILKQLGKPESLISHLDDRSAHGEREAMDARRALQILRWKARISFRSGMEDTIRELAAYLRPE